MLDLYTSAFRVPDFLYAIFSALFAGGILMPFLMSENKKGKEQANVFFGQIILLFGLGIMFACLSAFFLMSHLTELIVPGFSPELKRQWIFLSQILLLSPVVLGFSSLISSSAYANFKFWFLAMAPIFYNLGIILGIIFWFPTFGVLGIIWGVLFGALMHFLLNLFSLPGGSFWPRFSWFSWRKPTAEIYKFFDLSFFRALSLAANQGLMIFLVSRASFLAVGSVGILSLVWQFGGALVSLIGVSFAMAVFPYLSKASLNLSTKEYVEKVMGVLMKVGIFSIISSGLIYLFSWEMIFLIFQTGAFDILAAQKMVDLLQIFSFGFLPQALTLTLARAFYAKEDGQTPFLATLGGVLASVSLVFWLRDGLNNYLWAFVFGAWVQFLWLIFALGKNMLLAQKIFYGKFFLKILSVFLITFLIINFSLSFVDAKNNFSNFVTLFFIPLFSGFLFLIIFFGFLATLNKVPLKLFLKSPIDFFEALVSVSKNKLG